MENYNLPTVYIPGVCPHCGYKGDGIHLTGIDKEGEWNEWECLDCELSHPIQKVTQ